ncbi:MAG: transaldolase family protein [Mycetocola sp.]
MVTFFIDSADRIEVTRLLRTRLFGGVTTNPAILDKAGLGSADIPDLVAWANDAGAGRVFLQSWGKSAAELIERGEGLRALASNVVVKLPASRDGIEAAAQLSRGGDVLVTAVHAATQVFPVMASGATYLAPFVGRMLAGGRDGVAETIAIQHAVAATGSSLQVLAGSLRTPEQVLELASAGVRNMTFGPAVWDLFFDDDMTDDSVENFERLATTGA